MHRSRFLKEIVEKLKSMPELSMDSSTYINSKMRALFIDSEFGEWWARPEFVLGKRQTKHPKRAHRDRGLKIRSNPESIEAQIQKDRSYISLKYDTFVKTGVKALFTDSEFGEWWAAPSDIIKGGGHPVRSNCQRRTPGDIEAQSRKIVLISLWTIRPLVV